MEEIRIINVDENGNEIENIDWNIWQRDRVEEAFDESGELTHIISHCFKIPQEKIDEKYYNENIERQKEYALSVMANSFTDVQALGCVLLFPEWSGAGAAYKTGDRVRYKNKLYKVLTDHTSQDDWMPDVSPSLFVEISDPSIEFPEWKRPTGAHDAYNTGDKVTYNGKKYISLFDANTYSPEEYPDAWELVE